MDDVCTPATALGFSGPVHTRPLYVDTLSTASSTPGSRTSGGLEAVVHDVHTAYDNDESSLHPFPPPRMGAALPVDCGLRVTHQKDLGSQERLRPRNVRNPCAASCVDPCHSHDLALGRVEG